MSGWWSRAVFRVLCLHYSTAGDLERNSQLVSLEFHWANAIMHFLFMFIYIYYVLFDGHLKVLRINKIERIMQKEKALICNFT